MLVDYNTISETSRVLIYPSKRKFYKDELPVFSEKVSNFLNEFNELKVCFRIEYNRFVLVFISDETPLTLELNDKLVTFIQSLENEFEVVLLDKVNVCFKQGEFVQMKEISDFKKLIKNKGVSKKTIVFDNLINTKEEFENYWEIPAEESWVSHFFKSK